MGDQTIWVKPDVRVATIAKKMQCGKDEKDVQAGPWAILSGLFFVSLGHPHLEYPPD